MQLMLFNSLLMFDIVFIFFLFLIGVTCVLYYLPPSVRKSSNKGMRMRNSNNNNGNNKSNSTNSSSNNTNNDIENYESYTYQSKCRRNTYTNELAAENCDQMFLKCTDNDNDLRSMTNINKIRRNNDQNIRTSNTYNENSEDTVVRIDENFMRHTCNCNNRNINISKASTSGITLMQIKPSEPQLIEVEIERTNSLSCYVKAKDFDIRDCNGPVFDV